MTEIRCPECDRFMGEAHGTVVADIKCNNSSCKNLGFIKIVTADSSPADVHFKKEKTDE